MAIVTLENVSKRFGDVIAVDDFNLETEEGEFVVLVGPSGCGKSTMLRMIAGLEAISDGSMKIDGHVVNELPSRDRDIAMVFQSYALYPHMNVYDNMAFSLKLRKTDDGEIRSRVQDAARILGIEALLDRRPAALSGGQRQRVALGRAIVREPQVFLMDEPLSNLDATLRVGMRAEIAKLHRRLGVTSFYVTHDQIEAMTMGQRIVVMRDGHIQQISTPTALYDHPANKFVAGFIGSPSMNFLRARITDNGATVTGEGFSLPLDDAHVRAVRLASGSDVWVGIRPEYLGLAGYTAIPEGGGTLSGRVELVEPLGPVHEVQINVGGELLTVQLDRHAGVSTGDNIDLRVEAARVHLFDSDSEVSLTSDGG
ncbi:MAG TPA: sn-glycerol-3-phosphate ABC transporter ATP-binding protein UgpC [Gammaproteobacteria bacterium]|nr:sn-glycerol-3-phosphate ABC transporter ATP-binding protein UgpC [Gammaproteobacteria bacterium]